MDVVSDTKVEDIYAYSEVQPKVGSDNVASGPKGVLRNMQSIFDGFSKRSVAIAHKSSTSPNFDSRCSSVTMEQQPEQNYSDDMDVQSIQIARDISELAEVKLEDTVHFVPNIQYGKVLQVYSGSEFLIASRIYNGYTKVLRPQLYKFRIKMRGIHGSNDSLLSVSMCNDLASMILNKIVILYQLVFDSNGSNDTMCLGAEVYLGNLHINDIMNANIRGYSKLL